MKKQILTLALLASIFCVKAQSFLVPVEGFIGAQPSKVVTVTGDTIKGELKSAMFMNGLLKSFTYELAGTGEKRKFKAEEVKYLRIKASKMANLESMASGASSLRRMSNTNFDDIKNREFIEFEQALQPGDKTKYALLQLLNPGFDSKIKVYSDPAGQKTSTTTIGGMAVTGGEDKSYLVVKGGIKAERVKKKDYNESFAMLFGDCPELIKNFSASGEKLSFFDFATHVFDYDKACQ